MILESFPVGPLGCNCTILGDEVSREAIVVDPGDEAPKIQACLSRHKLTLTQILLTHAHIDHVGAALALKRSSTAPIFLNENDLPLLQSLGQQAAWLGVPEPEFALPDEGLVDGQIVGLPNYPASVLQTPGHTQGSVCLYFEPLGLLIAGDTLFAGGIGRTDLPGGNPEQILISIQNRLLPLPGPTHVLPGHGPATTIGTERRGNPFLQET